MHSYTEQRPELEPDQVPPFQVNSVGPLCLIDKFHTSPKWTETNMQMCEKSKVFLTSPIEILKKLHKNNCIRVTAEYVCLCLCVKGDVAVSPAVTVTSSGLICHVTAPPPTLLTERNTQCYYYHWQETCWTTPAIWAYSHSLSLSLWLMSSFLLFSGCSVRSFFFCLSNFLFPESFFPSCLGVAVNASSLFFCLSCNFYCTWH